jgi:hypothetical protein
VLFLIWQFFIPNQEYSLSVATHPATSATLPVEEEKLAVPQKRHRVAVSSTVPGFHFDVYMSLVWTLERAMSRSQTGGVVEVYAPAPFSFKFQSIVDALGLYHGETRRSDELIDAINSDMGDGGIDMVVLGTCEIECVVLFSFTKPSSHHCKQLARRPLAERTFGRLGR